MGYPLRLSVVFALCIILLGGAHAANIRGVIYDHTYNPIQKVVVTINTTPEQTKISTTGAYYFIVPAGSYEIRAHMTKNNITRVIAEQQIVVAEPDDVVRDLLLLDDLDLNQAFDTTLWSRTKDYVKEHIENFVIILLAAVTVFAVVYGISWYRRRILKAPLPAPVIPESILIENAPVVTDVEDVNIELIHPAEQKAHPAETAVVIAAQQAAPADERSSDDIMKERIIELIGASQGGLQQKDLRKEFSVSEAKISMVLSEMEGQGLIKKTKKGRTNYLQLLRVVKKA